MNHLKDLSTLNNRYIAWRHGESEANVRGYIASTTKTGVGACRLTKRGSMQVRESALRFKEQTPLDREVLILTSPFSRCVMTAHVIQDVFGLKVCYSRDKLRERNFGLLDGGSAEAYQRIWDADMRGMVPPHGVESLGSIIHRMTEVIWHVEQNHTHVLVILVSHADPLHILQTAFERRESHEHRTIPYLGNAEWRELNLKPVPT